ncbi:uncharacterized protein F5147DRAFT_777956 [Suillus discolor]|uniref:CxC2-like cysteine cluster KDZ transposase-associated domain-containing protein n=1 Tax=Suillus discolor TaxID=1912936 RepID=A0A9P7EYN3_9AGAM|nr:uncharacterized protein F5147DRAFT_777956 [Suillus discolor]KAG2097508.1 hypothetical protein F5147DRAFT_777956 [Suillus discolor]
MPPRVSIAADVEPYHSLHAISEGDPDFGIHSDNDLNGTGNVIVSRPMAKWYQASDAPLQEWAGCGDRSGFHQEYLLEDLRLESHGEADSASPCLCGELDEDGKKKEGVYHCEDCFGLVLLCRECCIAQHQQLPLHIIKMWNGQFFQWTTLKELGLVVRLGHSDCICPERGHVHFLVIHVNGVHHVNVTFCGCECRISHWQQLLQSDWYPSTVYQPQTACTRRVLEHFHVLMLSSKVSALEYYKTLEHLTDNTGIETPKASLLLAIPTSLSLTFCDILKRFSNLEDGNVTPCAGDLALICPTCPHPGINLPDNWESVDPSMRFLYFLILAMDANFRLKNHLCSSDTADPGLHTGLAYCVPNEEYKSHILKHVSQKDISSCSGFKSLAHAETKFSNSLRATGMGLCICARHEFVCPNGAGDLQKGECLAPLLVLTVIISYNIACQWKLNLLKRMAAIPEHLQVPLTTAMLAFIFGIPKFHCPAHDIKCATPHSLNLIPGVSRMDHGEGIERNWSEMNRVANSMKEMGPGSQHDTLALDDHFGHHNWRKYVSLGN